MRQAREGIARLQIALVALIVVAGIGAYALLVQGSSGSIVHLSITETDPVNQVDNFVPQNVTVKQGTLVTFAVQNGDDEDRLFTIASFNFNITISPHTTEAGTFTPDKAGTFKMFSPQTKPSAASSGKPGSPCTGYLTVTP